MGMPYTRAPHVEGASGHSASSPAPNAALLIDFDNVTMGMRSDLSKELRSLLNSDVIKGKVAVQRAYADWRRYPQYIVPLSENSVDLIFAPAYGSSKKNATDIRMAIDALELVFIRPEIGVFILLTGDSDFSSLVLKLKEYGKYVIGVGIQESTSDILVQNCDEYYSYTSLAGLRKTSDVSASAAMDPWVLVDKAVRQMQDRRDVMRSDRLKQVMLELDPSFDEGGFGFSKFSKFLAEASSKGLVHLKKLDNGQFEVGPGRRGGRDSGPRRDEGTRETAETSSSEGRGRDRDREKDRDRDRGRGGRGKDRDRGEAAEGAKPSREAAEARASDVGKGPEPAPDQAQELQEAYALLRKALGKVLGDTEDAVRDSDVKRKMLQYEKDFDETVLGFPKFSRFLKQAQEDGVIQLHRRDTGNYEVSMAAEVVAEVPVEAKPTVSETEEATPTEQTAVEVIQPSSGEAPAQAERGGQARLAPRGSRRRRGGGDDVPPIFEGQMLSVGGKRPSAEKPEPAPSTGLDAGALGLPTEPGAVVRYLSNRYRGVGEKTAEALVEAFGMDLFSVLNATPERILEVVPGARGEKVLDGWREDYKRRAGSENRPAAETETRTSSEGAITVVASSSPGGSEEAPVGTPGEDESRPEDDASAGAGEPQASSAGRKPQRRGTRRGRGGRQGS